MNAPPHLLWPNPSLPSAILSILFYALVSGQNEYASFPQMSLPLDFLCFLLLTLCSTFSCLSNFFAFFVSCVFSFFSMDCSHLLGYIHVFSVISKILAFTQRHKLLCDLVVNSFTKLLQTPQGQKFYLVLVQSRLYILLG